MIGMRKKIRQVFHFQPFSKKQRMVLNWWTKDSPVANSDGIIADGAIRSGKTVSMSLSFVLWAMESFNGHNFAMCGKTVGSFRRNVLATLKLTLAARGYTVEDKRSENLVIVTKNGVENYFYIFGGKDERSQDLIQGITLAGVFFDEVALMPESFVNQATGRCSVDGSKFWFNCNPASPSHWFKVNWIDRAHEKNILYLHFTMDDNLSLSERVKERYRAMYSGVFFQRYILGLWVIAEGLVYSMFDKDKHVIKVDIERKKNYKYFVSIDYGTVNPFAVNIYAFDGYRSIQIDELHYDGRKSGRIDNEAYYKMLCDKIGDMPIEKIIVDPSASGFIATVQKYGKYIVEGANNDVLVGIQEVTKYYNLGLLKIHESCEESIKEKYAYSWDDKNLDTTGNEKVIKVQDHHSDAERYYVRMIATTYNAWVA